MNRLLIGIYLILIAYQLNVESSPVQSTDKEVKDELNINEEIRKILEDLRARMHMDMTDSIGIPQLEPFSLDSIKINPEDTDLGVEFIGRNIVVTGLKQFEPEEVDFDILTAKFLLQLHLPVLNVKGDYETEGLIGGLIPFHGKGDMNIQIKGLKLIVDAQMDVGPPLSTDAEINVDFTEINIQLDGLMNGGELQDFFNKLLNDMARQIFDEYWSDMEDDVNRLISKIATQAMEGMDFFDLLKILSGQVTIFPPIVPEP